MPPSRGIQSGPSRVTAQLACPAARRKKGWRAPRYSDWTALSAATSDPALSRNAIAPSIIAAAVGRSPAAIVLCW